MKLEEHLWEPHFSPCLQLPIIFTSLQLVCWTTVCLFHMIRQAPAFSIQTSDAKVENCCSATVLFSPCLTFTSVCHTLSYVRHSFCLCCLIGMYVNWNFLWTLSQALKRSYQTYDELKIFLSCCWYSKQEEDDADVSKYKLDDEGDDVNDKEKRKARSESRSSSDSESGSSSDSSGSSERSRSR